MGIVQIARALTGKKVEPEAELIFWLNGFVALAVGAVCWIKLDLSAGASAGLAAVVFVALLASLFHPYAAILAGVLGSSVAAAIGGFIGASFGLRYGGTVGAWGGGVIAAAGLLVVSAAAYRKLVRASLAARVGGTESNQAGPR